MRCTTCDIAYNTIGMYNHHMKKFHDKALSCEECGKKFTNPSNLRTHFKTIHEGESVEIGLLKKAKCKGIR